MTELNFTTMQTLSAVDGAIERAQDKSVRAYLGMSQIGHACDRYLWLSFRWTAIRHIKASGLKAIEDGHAGEALMAQRLRMVDGITLLTEDKDGHQFGFTSVGGHFRGHMDGAILGILEAPKTWHVWEHKQVNPTKFKALSKAVEKYGEKSALKNWDEIYYGQAVSYMGLSGMTRHYLTCSTPGGRETISVRTEANPQKAKQLIERAESIIFAPEPPSRISQDPAWYQCRLCDMRDLCHGRAVPEVNCRTCAHATPQRDGTWLCERHNRVLSTDEQKQGCQAHRFIPSLLENIGTVADASQEENWVAYLRPDGTKFSNGGRVEDMSSEEIKDMA
jgi:hypothetical protein